MSFLERRSVRPPTAEDYVRRLRFFVRWCMYNRLDWSDPAELDVVLLTLFDEWFFEGIAQTLFFTLETGPFVLLAKLA